MLTINKGLNVVKSTFKPFTMIIVYSFLYIIDLTRFHLFSFFSILYIYSVSKINSKYPKTTTIVTILLTLPILPYSTE